MIINIFVYSFYLFKFTFYKLLYGKSIDFHIFKCFINGTLLIKKKGKLLLEGKFTARGVNINISSGCIKIGNEVFMNRGCSINCHNKVIIGENTMFGENVLIYDHNHLVENGLICRNKFTSKPVVVGKNCWIGANVVITQGVTIGNNSIIAAGSIVSRDVPEGVTLIQRKVNEFRSNK